MTNPLSKEAIDDLRDYTARKLESLTENTQHPAQDQARHHAETILALIAERDRLRDAVTTHLHVSMSDLLERTQLAEAQETIAALRAERDRMAPVAHAAVAVDWGAVRAERDRLLAVAEAAEAFRNDEDDDRAETMDAVYAALDAWKASR